MIGRLISFASSVLAASLFGAMLGQAAVFLCDHALSCINRWFSPLHARALAAGAASVAVCTAAAVYNGILFQYLPLAFLFFGLLLMAGLVDSYLSFYVLTLAAMIASGIAHALGLEHYHRLSSIIAGAILVATGVFIFPASRRPYELLRLGILASVAVCADQLCVGDAWAMVLVSGWFFVCGGMACDRFTIADRRLHLLDRVQRLFRRNGN